MATMYHEDSHEEDETEINRNMQLFKRLMEEKRQSIEPGLLTVDASAISVQNEAAYDVEIFINEMEGYPCLWNPSTRSHHDQNMRSTAWEELSNKFGKPVNFLKTQWKNLKDNLRRCMVKRTQMSKSGAEAHTLPKCKFFSQLQFLHEKVVNNETETNVGNEFTQQPHESSSLPQLSPTTTPGQTPSTQDTDSPALPTNQSSTKRKRTQIGKENGKKSTADDELLMVIKDMNQQTNTMVNRMSNSTSIEENENMLFCKSLVAILERLPPRENALAKMQIQEVLFDLEFKE